jgi:anti-anti-sigma factor
VSQLSHQTAVDGAVAVVTLRGELDLAGCAELEPELERLARDDGVEAVVIDLRGLEFLDSSGLRLVVTTDQRLSEARRRLALVPGSDSVQRVFEITRMGERLSWVDSPEEARSGG